MEGVLLMGLGGLIIIFIIGYCVGQMDMRHKIHEFINSMSINTEKEEDEYFYIFKIGDSNMSSNKINLNFLMAISEKIKTRLLIKIGE